MNPLVKAFGIGFSVGLVLLVVLPIVMPESNYLIPGYWKATFGAAVLAGGVAMIITERNPVLAGTWVALGVMCAFVIRVAIDIHHDRTNHNLLPFELILDFGFVWVLAVTGGFFGALATRETDRRVR